MIIKRAQLPMTNDEQLALMVDQQLSLITQAINGNLAFGALGSPSLEGGGPLENINGVWVVHLFGGAANTDVTVPHRLGRIPVGLINVERPSYSGSAPVAGQVYFGSTGPTARMVTVRCTAASKQATFLLF